MKEFMDIPGCISNLLEDKQQIKCLLQKDD